MRSPLLAGRLTAERQPASSRHGSHWAAIKRAGAFYCSAAVLSLAAGCLSDAGPQFASNKLAFPLSSATSGVPAQYEPAIEAPDAPQEASAKRDAAKR